MAPSPFLFGKATLADFQPQSNGGRADSADYHWIKFGLTT